MSQLQVQQKMLSSTTVKDHKLRLLRWLRKYQPLYIECKKGIVTLISDYHLAQIMMLVPANPNSTIIATPQSPKFSFVMSGDIQKAKCDIDGCDIFITKQRRVAYTAIKEDKTFHGCAKCAINGVVLEYETKEKELEDIDELYQTDDMTIDDKKSIVISGVASKYLPKVLRSNVNLQINVDDIDEEDQKLEVQNLQPIQQQQQHSQPPQQQQQQQQQQHTSLNVPSMLSQPSNSSNSQDVSMTMNSGDDNIITSPSPDNDTFMGQEPTYEELN